MSLYCSNIIPKHYPGYAQEVISKTGTVKYFSFEGGFFGIAGDDGINYDPINLDQDYKKDNLKIKFKGKYKDRYDEYKKLGNNY